MGLLDSIFGGGSGSADDPYADILTPAQRNQMQVNGLLAMAGAFADAGMPSRLPIPFGSALGKAAQALGAGQESGMKTAIENALAAQKVRDLRNLAQYRTQFFGDQDKLYKLLQEAGGVGTGAAGAPGTRPAGTTSPAGTYAGTGAGGGGGGALPLPADLRMGSDYASGVTAPAPGGVGRFDASGGLLNYPAATDGGLSVGGRGLLSPDRESFGPATPSSDYAPGGSLYPFKDLGVVPGTGGAAAPVRAASGAAVGAMPDAETVIPGAYYDAKEGLKVPGSPGYDPSRAGGGGATALTPSETPLTPSRNGLARVPILAPTATPPVTPVPGGTNGIDLRKRAALDAILSGMQTAQGGPSAQRLAQFAGPGAADAPAAADTIPDGGGLLGVAADLRAPIEADPFARSPSPGDPRGVVPLIRQAFLRQGIDPSVPIKVAGSEGLSSFQSTVPSAKGPGGREPSWGAFQLYTGGGLGNQFQKETGLDPSDPKNEAATIDWVAKNVNRTGWSPWHGAAKVGIGDRTGLPGGDLPPPDQVIPSGPGAGGGLPPVVRAQYAAPGGGGGVPGMPQLAPPAQLAPPGVPGLPGASTQGPGLPQAGAADPRMNALLLELARRNAAAEVLGMGNPYGSLLTVLQGSPQYKAAVESATAAARIAQEEPSKLRTDAAKARLDMIQKLGENALTLDKDNNVVEIPGMRDMLGHTAGTIEKAKQEATSMFALTDARVIGPDGQPTTTKMPIYEYIFRQQQGARNASMGAKPQPGDIVSSPISGPPPEGFEYRMDPNGKMTAVPIPGTPAEQVVKDRERKQAVSDQATLVARDIMVQNANRVEDLVQNSTLPVTGTAGPFLSRIPGTAANDARVMIETIKARSSLDQLNQMRNSNPTGAGLGNVSNAEGDRLAAAISNLDQSQTKEQFLFNLRRVKQEYIDIVHGPGTYSKLSDEPVLKVPALGAARPAPAIGTVQDGHSFKGGNPADPNNWQKVP